MRERQRRSRSTAGTLDGWEIRTGKQENRRRVGKAELDPADPRKLVAREGGSDLVNVIAQSQGADLVSTARWGDCRLEVEVMLSKGSNSGMYLMGIYEVQLLDGIADRATRTPLGAITACRVYSPTNPPNSALDSAKNGNSLSSWWLRHVLRAPNIR